MRRDSVKMMAFFAAPSSSALAKATAQRLQQGLALGVLVDGGRKLRKRVQIGDLGFDRGAVGGRQRFELVILRPFLRGLVERLVVLVQLLFEPSRAQHRHRASLASGREIDVNAPAMANVEDASNLRSTSVISDRWLAGRACRLSRRRYSETSS